MSFDERTRRERNPRTSGCSRWAQYAQFHPDLRRLAAVLPREILGPRRLPVLRRLSAMAPPLSDAVVRDLGDGVTVRQFGNAGTASDPAPALLWMHGGGYVIGSAAQDDRWCRRLAQRAGIRVVSVDYRLAPEFPHPTPVLDCYRGLSWMAEQPHLDPNRLIIAGASAGGGLTAALALHARDLGIVHPILQLMIYPMLDDRLLVEQGACYRIWGPRSNAFGWARFMGDADPGDAVPARRRDLHELPRAWIGVGSRDLLCEQDVRYHEALRAAGTPSELAVFDGAFHGFDVFARRTSIASRFEQEVLAAIRTALSRAGGDGATELRD